MIWELAGDYAYDSAKSEYFIGDTLLTTHQRPACNGAAPVRCHEGHRTHADHSRSTSTSDVYGFALGDANYPINPKMQITNNSTVDDPRRHEDRVRLRHQRAGQHGRPVRLRAEGRARRDTAATTSAA